MKNAYKVEPIRKLKDIKTIKKLLSDHPRNYALFVVGINTSLRGSDLLALKVGDVRELKPMQDFEIRERKTKKHRRITLNRAAMEAIQKLLATRPEVDDEEFLFVGRTGKPLTRDYLRKMIKKWCRAINLRGNYGSHSLRKTWGYHQRVRFGAGLPELTEAFNHSNQSITLRYLCIQPDEIKNIYNNEI
ncbi:MAG: tyrosine-type recombinase/integrase [Desulfobacterales bacterium]|jgi:integrase